MSIVCFLIAIVFTITHANHLQTISGITFQKSLIHLSASTGKKR